MKNKLLKYTYGSKSNEEDLSLLSKLLKHSKIPDNELSRNLGLFINPSLLGRILFMNFLYEKNINIQGVIADFGCRYGQNSVLFSSLRGIYEPFNRLRKIISFDTFNGFPNVTVKDAIHNKKGDYSTHDEAYENLVELMQINERFSPLEHLCKHEIVKGNVCITLPEYIKKYPSTIFSLCYFDFDIYKPTKECLEIVLDRMPKGGIIGFDELNDEDTPGETLALLESINLSEYTLSRFSPSARTTYLVRGV
jgi:hypothetical protein